MRDVPCILQAAAASFGRTSSAGSSRSSERRSTASIETYRHTMIAWLLTAFSTGLFAICLYQWIAHPFFLEDLMYYLKMWRFKRETQTRMRKGVVTYLDTFLYQARKTPDKAFLVYESLSLTYRDVDKRSNRFARVFRADGSLKMGDVVALLMCNHPDFVCIWFGLCKLGCEVAFLNFNIKASSLLCCLQSCGATSLVVGAGRSCGGRAGTFTLTQETC